MTNEEKLKALCQWLTEQGITDYAKDQTVAGVKVDLLLPTQGIAVHLSDGKNQVFYRAVCKDYSAFFVRDVDTMEFVLEKMQNCMQGLTLRTLYVRNKIVKNSSPASSAATADEVATAIRTMGKVMSNAGSKRPRKRIFAQRVTYNKA